LQTKGRTGNLTTVGGRDHGRVSEFDPTDLNVFECAESGAKRIGGASASPG